MISGQNREWRACCYVANEASMGERQKTIGIRIPRTEVRYLHRTDFCISAESLELHLPEKWAGGLLGRTSVVTTNLCLDPRPPIRECHTWSGFTAELLRAMIRTDRFGTVQRSKASQGRVQYLNGAPIQCPRKARCAVPCTTVPGQAGSRRDQLVGSRR